MWKCDACGDWNFDGAKDCQRCGGQASPTRERQATTKLSPRHVAPTKSGSGSVEKEKPERTIKELYELAFIALNNLSNAYSKIERPEMYKVNKCIHIMWEIDPDAAPCGQRASRRNWRAKQPPQERKNTNV